MFQFGSDFVVSLSKLFRFFPFTVDFNRIFNTLSALRSFHFARMEHHE